MGSPRRSMVSLCCALLMGLVATAGPGSAAHADLVPDGDLVVRDDIIYRDSNIAYNTRTGESLVLVSEYGGDKYVQVLKADGTPKGPRRVVVSNYADGSLTRRDAVIYNPTSNNYMLLSDVVHKGSDTYSYSYPFVQAISTDGIPGTRHELFEMQALQASDLAYDSVNNRFMAVVWGIISPRGEPS